jgi:hypothetical protein
MRFNMFDPSTVTVAFNAMKFATETLQSLHTLKVDADSLEKTTDALRKLGDAQTILLQVNQHLFALQIENNELKSELNSKNKWEQQLEKYELTSTDGGATVYKYKNEPTHYICPSCINKNEIQILQDTRSISGRYGCPGCNKEFPVSQRREQKIDYPRL